MPTLSRCIQTFNANFTLQKSTYFYPKLITGLVMNKLDRVPQKPTEEEGKKAEYVEPEAEIIDESPAVEEAPAFSIASEEDFVFAIDAAASELYDEESKLYYFPGESKMLGQKVVRTSEQMIIYYENLLSKFPIFSIEDGLNEEDWEGWQTMTKCLGTKMQLVGDDLFVTNKDYLAFGINNKICNAVLIKLNQIGTVSEAIDTLNLAFKYNYTPIIWKFQGLFQKISVFFIFEVVKMRYIKSCGFVVFKRIDNSNYYLLLWNHYCRIIS